MSRCKAGLWRLYLHSTINFDILVNSLLLVTVPISIDFMFVTGFELGNYYFNSTNVLDIPFGI